MQLWIANCQQCFWVLCHQKPLATSFVNQTDVPMHQDSFADMEQIRSCGFNPDWFRIVIVCLPTWNNVHCDVQLQPWGCFHSWCCMWCLWIAVLGLAGDMPNNCFHQEGGCSWHEPLLGSVSLWHLSPGSHVVASLHIPVEFLHQHLFLLCICSKNVHQWILGHWTSLMWFFWSHLLWQEWLGMQRENQTTEGQLVGSTASIPQGAGLHLWVAWSAA